MSRRSRPTSSSAPSSQAASFGAEEPCVICLDASPDILLMPCRHVCCSGCFPRVGSTSDIIEGKSKCPCCRAALEGFKKCTRQELTQPLSQQQAMDVTTARAVIAEAAAAKAQATAAKARAAATPVTATPKRAVFCSIHNLPCVIRRAATNGRLYFSCEPTGKGCFCSWASADTGAAEGIPHCNCSLAAIEKTSSSEKNPGRKYWGCGELVGKKCTTGMLCWAEGPKK